jgi:O-6-methylguanine DNA methyltransferase
MKFTDLVMATGSACRDEDRIADLLRRSRARLEKVLKGMRRPSATVGVVQSPLGDLLVATSARGVVLTHYLDKASDLTAILANLRLVFDLVENLREARQVGAEVCRYLAGDAKALRREVDLSLAGAAFQKKVLEKLQAIPRGALISYQALGAAVGSPRGARAIGQALHNNPVPIYVPCHRVIAADGRIGGYAGGTARKLQLLRSEGFCLDGAAVKIPDSVVWGHKGTKIYCRRNCRSAARVNRARIMFFADSKEAQRAGMRPCKLCRPLGES